MKRSNVNPPLVRPPIPARTNLSGWSRSLLIPAVVFASLLFLGTAAWAQVPINQLHFAFMDAPGTTTTVSDTSLNSGALHATLSLLSPAGAAADLHGAVGTGVTNTVAVNLSRAMDFTAALTPSQTNQPVGNAADTTENSAVVAADLNDAILGANLGSGGVVNNFVVSMWFKQKAMMPTGANIGPRLWILNSGTAGVDAGGSANTLGLKFQANNQLYFQFGTDTMTVGPALASPFPTNKWLFVAVTYDGTNVNMYYGSDTSAAQLIGTATSLGRSISLGGSACLAIGNRHSATTNARGFDGYFNDFRFYSGGVGTAAFVESIREAAVGNPPNIGNIYPNGNTLMQGTNALAFTVSSVISTITNVSLVLNGINVSSQLQISGPANNLSVTYPALSQNQPINTAVITAIDNNGYANSATATFDTFGPNNFIIEAEEFDFNGGQFIDNPDYTDGNPADANSYYGLDSEEGIDTHKGSSAGTGTGDYRAGTGDGTRTQTGVATGELPWPKFASLVDASGTPIVGHVVGDWSSAEWQNYTKTFPAGKFNVYGRVSAGVAATITFARVTSGQGTATQTTTNLGTFTFADTSYSLYEYVPLLDNLGNLAVVSLAGVNTVRATSGGGANADFYMFVPANTNLPTLSNVYPDGKYLFEPTNKMVFTVSSPITTISTNNIQLTLNGTNVSSQLVFSGGPSIWNVSYTGLLLDQTYIAGISVVDALGNPAHNTITIDTWNPVFQVEAEDFDFSSGQYIDNPVPTAGAADNSYYGQVGTLTVDESVQTSTPPYAGASASNYRPSDPTATTVVTDTARKQFTGGALDYNVGFLGPNFWQNYTKTWPVGTFNIYGRMASGANIGTIHASWQEVIAGWGTAQQLTQNIGTFSIPTTGGYSSYMYVPLLDRFGNYAQVTMGGTNTCRVQELTDPGSFGLNINFYMLLNSRTDLPRVDAVYPDGSTLMQPASTLSFVASSPTYGLSTTNIHVVLNGTNISSRLAFSGSATSWSVSYPGLQPNQVYSAGITITDAFNQVHATTVNFDTFSTNNFTWEAEDWDFDPANSPVPNGTGLRFIDNPVPTDVVATNSYVAQIGDPGIDESTIFQNIIGTYVYRPSDYVSTQVSTDAPRPKYLNAQLFNLDPGILDYNIDYLTNGAWINYTRTFPAGQFRVYARLSGGNGAFNMTCSQVTFGAGTLNQVVQPLGNFVGNDTSFTNWLYVPLVNTNTGLPVTVTLGGVETLQMTGDYNENANFFMLVPVVTSVTLSATLSGGNILVAFPTQSGFNYTLNYKNNLTDPTWTPLGAAIPGDGTIKTMTDSPGNGKRFYQLSFQ